MRSRHPYFICPNCKTFCRLDWPMAEEWRKGRHKPFGQCRVVFHGFYMPDDYTPVMSAVELLVFLAEHPE